jgi:hypothetical protein
MGKLISSDLAFCDRFLVEFSGVEVVGIGVMSASEPTDKALARHARACRRGEAGYTDPETGLFVMTSVYLADQGACCGSGCRHCPYSAEEQRQAGRPASSGAWPWHPDED